MASEVVSKLKLFSSAYKAFYNCINTYVPNPHSAGTHWIYPSEPLNKLSNSDAYPMIIIEGPDFDTEAETLKEDKYNGEMVITVLTTSRKSTDELAESVWYAIETRQDTYFLPLNIEDIELTNTAGDPFDNGAIRGHTITLTISFSERFNKVDA